MKLKVKKSNLKGILKIPGSKSHTIRAYVFAALSSGVCEISNPLVSEDTESCLNSLECLGAKVLEKNKNKTSIVLIILPLYDLKQS